MFDSSIPPLMTSAQAALGPSDRQLRRRYAKGELVRVRAGVYVPVSQWAELRYDERYRTFVHAASLKLARDAQFSHSSAAVLWHLPVLGPWPPGVDVLSNPGANAGSSRGIRRHGLGLDPDATRINQAGVTSLARTVFDTARTSSFAQAVCVADAALGLPERGSFRAANDIAPVKLDTLRSMLDDLGPSVPGAVKADRVFRFSTGQSGSVGESVSRVQFHVLGFPPPELQVPFFDSEGLIGYADFYWPELDLIGEFDGDVKYLGKTYRRGMLPEEVVLAEKHREDRLRRVVRAFARWDWPVALDQRQLSERLRPHGLVAIR